MIRRLDSATQTIYAELLERSIHFEAASVLGAAGSGSLVEKRIKGRKYWYIQKSEGRGKRQLYVGPDSAPLQEWITQVHEERGKNRVQREELVRLCAMVVSGGVKRESAGFVKVLEILGEAEVFRLGGVLIGTVAYRALGTTLGVEFDEAALATQDVDIAQEPDLAVGLVHGTEYGKAGERLLGSDLGIQPIPALDPRSPSTSYSIRSRNLRVDFSCRPVVHRSRKRYSCRRLAFRRHPCDSLSSWSNLRSSLSLSDRAPYWSTCLIRPVSLSTRSIPQSPGETFAPGCSLEWEAV